LLLAAWRRWSMDFLPRLDGVFASALRSGDDMFLSCDPSGLRKLYYHAGLDGQLAFATDLDSLLRVPGTPRRLAHRSLHEYLRFLDIAAPNTLFEDVRAVEAGQLVHWAAGGTTSCSWPQIASDDAAPTSFSEAVELLDAHLQRSVQTRLDGSSRPAAFLSGGIDSSLLCAMANVQRNDVTAVTVGFDAAGFDETPVAQRIASHLGMKHEVLRFNREQYLSAFESLSEQMEQPMADPATAATLLAYGHCRSRFDAVLDGMGADEAIGSMPPRHVRLAVGYASLLPPSMRSLLTKMLREIPGLSEYAPILDFEHPADTMIRWRGFTRPEIEALCGEPVSFEHTQFYRTFSRFPRSAHYERHSALMNAMPCDRLNQATLISGAHVRYPFWDRRTDRFIRQLRTDFRHTPGEPKRVLRALLARYVPRDIWDMPKHAFNFPLWEFLSGDDFELVRRYLDRGRWRQAAVLSAEHVQRYAQQFIAGDRNLTFRVWALVVLGAWLEKHDKLD
jgi:asparagine synthase (glutamine-hydrolysing)